MVVALLGLSLLSSSTRNVPGPSLQDHAGVPPAPVPAGEVRVSELSTMLATKRAALAKDPGGQRSFAVLEPLWRRLDALLAEGKLETGADYFLAAQLADEPLGAFERQRLHHELALCSLALAEPNAPALLASSWDRLLASTGRVSRLGNRMRFDVDAGKSLPAPVDPNAFPAVAALLRDPAAARAAAKTGDNAELQTVRAADQKVRGPEAPELTTQEEIRAYIRAERDRRVQVTAIVKAGGAKTAADYEAAALVMQHGDEWDSYAMAHELCLASLVLDPKLAAWLSAATYDRMLLSAGYRQRFGTQFNSAGLRPLDEGVGDGMRAVLRVPPLAKARSRGEEFRKANGGGTSR